MTTCHQLLLMALLIINSPFNILSMTLSLPRQLYVVPFPSLFGLESDGSFEHPYTSLQQALDQIESHYYHEIYPKQRITINLYPTYYFVDTVRFTQVHSHTQLTTMTVSDVALYERLLAQEPTHKRLPKATISGGIPITNWTQVSGNTYSAVVPSSVFVNQLFINNQRIVRTRVPTNYSEYLHYAAPFNDSTLGRYGFQYQLGQFNYTSLTDAMVVVYHSWTESHHYIDRLIPENNTILFTNPSDRPIGTYGIQGQQRFHIENLCEALVPNSFCFVNETRTVYLMTNGSYDPRNVEVITPVNEIVVLLAGDSVYNPIEDVIVNNVIIQHGAWDLTRTQQADSASAAFLKTAAFFVVNASSIIISNIEISHTGTYGLWINSGTANINFLNSEIMDMGAGGMWIGRTIIPMPTPAVSIKVISNEIGYGGNVFPSGVGINVGGVEDVVITDNVIHHLRYNGMSIGSSLGYGPSWTKNTLVQGNYVYNTGQHILCDQGGIYTVGVLPGTIITGNVVKNVFSYSVYMWGIYLDEGSSDILVANNVVYNTGWGALFQHYGANNTIINNVFARAAVIAPPHPGDPYPDGDTRVQNSENHTSWIYTRNIIYDTYQGANHSAFKSDQPNVTVSFSNNVYYNPFNTPLLFVYQHQQMSFAEWQATGHDNNSVIADPLFAGDVSQCDFFKVRADSPAAKLGFVNITKLSKWTPGCDTDDDVKANQFYHW